MPVLPFRIEIAGQMESGTILTGDENEQYLQWRADHGLKIAQPAASVATTSDEQRPRGRPSRDEEIAAAIDALDDELDRLGSIKAQARAVRAYLEEQGADGEPAAGLSTIETFLRVYRNPRASSALKIAQKTFRR